MARENDMPLGNERRRVGEMRTRQVHGIRGGLTEEERHQAAKTSREP
jgi:hypothetical protein